MWESLYLKKKVKKNYLSEMSPGKRKKKKNSTKSKETHKMKKTEEKSLNLLVILPALMNRKKKK